MRLEPGRRVGDYEILGPLGAGGMGEVYRARDASLGREVAIKVLPKELSQDPGNLSRLEREAKLLAALRHPNIAVIHGLERDEDGLFLVLELIPGATLAERLRSGALSLSEARNVFLQIARALEAAHERDIIHRDLKPENVKLDEDGTVKLLDFGLGKALPSVSSERKTATFTGPATSSGLLLGTPAYMSPEQARGQSLTARTDIWSFGICLFEALTGQTPFARRSLPDTLSAILKEEPRWERLDGPPGLEKLLRRCLRKEERERLRHIGDARIELSEMPEHRALRGRSGGRSVARWVAAAATLGVVVGTWLGTLLRDQTPATRDVSRHFVIRLPNDAPLSLSAGGALAVSRDGSRLVYASRQGDKRQLVLRSLDQLENVPLPGTDGAVSAFFSPDGGELAFFAGSSLKTVALPGGSPVFVAENPSPRGGTWLGSGRILFAPASTSGLVGVSVPGSSPSPVTSPMRESERSHRWPTPLPGNERALFTSWREDGSFSIALADLRNGETRVVLENAAHPRFVEPDYLLFARSGDLFAVRFDPKSGSLLTEPGRVAGAVAHDPRTGAAFYDASEDGALFFVPSVEKSENDLVATAVFVTLDGAAVPITAPTPGLQVPRLSPDGRSLLMTAESGAGEHTDIYSLDLARGGLTRLTFEGNNGAAIWSHDGSRIFFASDRDDAVLSIYATVSDGAGEPRRLTRAESPQFPTSLSPDGRYLAYVELHPETTFDIWLLEVETGRATPLIRTRYEDAGATYSRDGRFLAYASNESGRHEVYVRSLKTERRVLVSSRGGSEPVWGRDGNILYFRSESSMMAAEVQFEPELRVVAERTLFDAPYDTAGTLYANYDVDARGDRFVMIRADDEPTASEIHVVLNWAARLPRDDAR